MTEIPPEAVGVPAYLRLYAWSDIGEPEVITLKVLVNPGLLREAKAEGGISLQLRKLELVAA